MRSLRHAAARSICGLAFLAPAIASATTLFSAGIGTPSGSQGASDSPTPVSFTQPMACSGTPPSPNTCWRASASAGLSLAALGVAEAEHGGIEPPGFSVTSFANGGASFSGYEVVLSGPSGQSAEASLNLIFDGFATIAVSAGIGSASVNIGTSLTGPHGAATDSGALMTELVSQTTTGSGLLTGWRGFPMAVTTSSIAVDAGDVVTIALSLAGQAECSTIAFSRVSFCPASFNVPGFSFATTGPVFDLPAGWTANSLDGTIVNNTFIPEPSTGLLFSGGLVLLLTVEARTRRCLRSRRSARLAATRE